MTNRLGIGHQWDHCDWCQWWGWLETTVESVPYRYRLQEFSDGPPVVLCMRCWSLDEPPWRPNHRDSAHERLLRIFQPPGLAAIDSTNILRLIAEYIAVNMPLEYIPFDWDTEFLVLSDEN